MTKIETSTLPDLDGLTLGALSVLAYCSAFIIHEGLGHGSACLLAGGKAIQLNAVFFQCTEDRLSPAGLRWLAAGGSIAELALGASALVAVGKMDVARPRLRYFLWLFGVVSLLAVFGYPLFSGIGGFGDWAVLIQGLRPAWAYRVALVVVGALLYYGLLPRWMMRSLDPFLGHDRMQRKLRIRRLTLFPYLVGGVTAVLAGLLNPEGFEMVLLSAAAASLGGTSLLAWYPAAKPGEPQPGSPVVPLAIHRSRALIALAACVFAFFVLVLGPGLNFKP